MTCQRREGQEAYYATNEAYINYRLARPLSPRRWVSGTVTLVMVAATDSFNGTATSSRGSGKIYSYDSITDTFVSN
jgi:hypothetical protein